MGFLSDPTGLNRSELVRRSFETALAAPLSRQDERVGGGDAPVEDCPQCGGPCAHEFRNGVGFVLRCDACAGVGLGTESVVAYPSRCGGFITLRTTGASIVLALAEARQINGALTGAIAIRDREAGA